MCDGKGRWEMRDGEMVGVVVMDDKLPPRR